MGLSSFNYLRFEATITKHEGFRWVWRKLFYTTELNS